ncbi:MAG: exonuclease SbcCD subunit D C-terminal domain-containing protein [Myxococcales bacterium]|nr:exonuclease SbcCD subunit D C-terminal domain-containing protein [Myxococcales bacterium]
MRILHTADWHLGQSLHGVSRAPEHAQFLSWLLNQLEINAVDTLIVAGDVFDVATPSAQAQAQYFGFLAQARSRLPGLSVVVLGGNHDAPARLDAARPVLDALHIHVVGGLPIEPEGTWDLSRILIPLPPPPHPPEIVLIAVPFLRPKDLPPSMAEAQRRAKLPPKRSRESEGASGTGTNIAEGHRYVYHSLVEAAEMIHPSTVALVATGHAVVAGGQLSESSERRIQHGNQQALSCSDTFPTQLSYVALGHLHLSQSVGSLPLAWYAGSPLPLSMAEIGYQHQVLLVDIHGKSHTKVTSIPVPRFRDLIRIPTEHAPLENVLKQLATLPSRAPHPQATLPPLVEARVRVDTIELQLKHQIEEALHHAWAQLARIDVKRPVPSDEKQNPSAHNLHALAPEDVFCSLHQRIRTTDPSAELISAFRELMESMEIDG